MKRGAVLIIIFMTVFLIGTVSAELFKIDNIKSYNETAKEITITNTFGLGRIIAKATLDTPQVNYVVRGKDRLVAQFTINNSDVYTNGVLDNLDLYDIKKGNREITRTFTWKYRVLVGTKDVEDYKTVCEDIIVEKVVLQNCSRVEIGKHQESVYEWKEFKPEELSNFAKGEITIGLFTDVFEDDYIEWQPTLYGVKIDEWAAWTEGLNVELMAYWNFNENTGTKLNNVANPIWGNLTLGAADKWVPGKSGTAYLTSGVDNINTTFMNSTWTAVTINFWLNRSGECGHGKYPFSTSKAGGATQGSLTGYFLNGNNGLITWVNQGGATQATQASPIGIWQMMTLVVNATDTVVYQNGTYIGTMAFATNFIEGEQLYMFGYASGNQMTTCIMDEVGVWGRSLTPSEITYLYDSGIGTVWASPAEYPQFSNYWDNNATQTNVGNVTLNVTVTSTNGTVWVTFNGTNYTATNYSFSPTVFNVTILNYPNGTYSYNWSAFGNGTAYNFNRSYTRDYTILSVDMQPPQILFINQTPLNITSFNIYTTRLNVTYNITDISGINTSSVYYYSKTNTSQIEIWQYINGTETVEGYQAINTHRVGVNISNSSATWHFIISSNLIYPSVFNLDPEVTGLEDKSIYVLNSPTKYLKIKFYNLSITSYGTFNFMANSTSGAGDLRIYFCNSSYVNGSAAPNCGLIVNYPSTQIFNYTLSPKSAYNFVPFNMNVSEGTIAGIKVTDENYFGLVGPTSGSWHVYYVTNISRPDTIQNTTNAGASWSNFSGTVNAFVSQYTPLNYTNYYYICANDTLGNGNCSEVRSNIISEVSQTPSAPGVFLPTIGIYHGNISINWTASESSPLTPLRYYNISLMVNNSQTFNKTINTNNSLNTSYIWDSAGTPDGNYTIRVAAVNNASLVAFGYSAEFQLHNIFPNITLVVPGPYANSSTSSVTFNCSAMMLGNGTIMNISLWLNGIRNYTLTDGVNNYTSLQITKDLADGSYNWTCSADDDLETTGWAIANRTLTVDTTLPSITITSPTNTTYQSGYIINYSVTITLNASVSDSHLQACWINNGTANVTVVCGTNLTIVTGYGPYHFMFYANDSFGHVQTAEVSANWAYVFRHVNVSFNKTSYETSTENFILNVDGGGLNTVSSANFIYNGTAYPSISTVTCSGTTNCTIVSILNIPILYGETGLNKTFFWNLSYGGLVAQNSTINSFNVSAINLTYCDAINKVPYVNYTFKDETTGLPINGSIPVATFTYWVGSGAVNKTYLHSLVTDFENYTYCFSPSDRPINYNLAMQYASTGYPQRTYSVAESTLSNATFAKTLYLLSAANGIYSSIQVIESSGQPISGVEITAERQFVGVWTTISQIVTGSDGLATFWVNPNYLHRFTAVKSGYSTGQVSITPTQSLYTLTLLKTGQSEASYTSDISGLSWYLHPSSGPIQEGSHNFNVTVTSTESNLVNCKFQLLNASNLTVVLKTNTSITNSSYCYVSFDYIVLNNSRFFGRLSVITTESNSSWVVIESDWKWITMDIENPYAWRIVTSFFHDLTTITDFGEDDAQAEFSRFMAFFLLMTIAIGLLNYFFGIEYTSPGVSIIVIFVIVLIASVGGFLNIDFGADVMRNRAFFGQYIFAMIAGIMTINFLLIWKRRADE